jgi:hypothetical protein
MGYTIIPILQVSLQMNREMEQPTQGYRGSEESSQYGSPSHSGCPSQPASARSAWHLEGPFQMNLSICADESFPQETFVIKKRTMAYENL